MQVEDRIPSNTVGFSFSDLRSEHAINLRESILDALAIPSDGEREDQIVHSYSKTFQWLFQHSDDPNRPSFADWLQSNPMSTSSSPIFWINGLPGSGKSTVMRHIRLARETKALVNKWSEGGDSPVNMASFYLWESGTILQRSREGLLRSLLLQLVGKQSRLIPLIFEELWSRLWKSTTLDRVRILSSWDMDTLTSAFLAYFQLKDRARTFLIIDGLDELEGDQGVLIDL